MFRTLRSLAAALQNWLSMPVLVKELAETAARRRTYVLRVVYAVMLYGFFGLAVRRRLLYGGQVDEEYGSEMRTVMLGYGKEILSNLFILQMYGIAIFQPALMCGRITQEKERDSLILLFLTELRPWEIVWQKYLGGLVPMLSFFLLGLPLAGVAFAFGGFQSGDLAEIFLALFLTSAQVGAIALLCSAWCRSTVGALISSYVLAALLYFGALLPGTVADSLDFLRILVPQYALETSHGSALSMVGSLFPILCSIALLLLLARFFLVRRAVVPPLNFLPRLFAHIDRFMKRANRFTGGIVLSRETGGLPGDDPVFWRETQRRTLGKWHYLLRLFCAIEVPTVFLCGLIGALNTTSTAGLSNLTGLLTVLALFILSASASNALVSERVGQTLDVLLTTPLSAAEIVRQKERALRRLEWILAAPLLTAVFCKAYVKVDFGLHARQAAPSANLVCAVLLVFIYLPMTTLLSLWIGLRVRTRFQATITALGTVTFWMALGPMLLVILDAWPPRIKYWLSLISPLSIAFFNELESYDYDDPWFGMMVSAAFYIVIALFIRYRLFTDADRLLRR